jgi:hypothetical protein
MSILPFRVHETRIGKICVCLDSVMLFKCTVNSKLVEGFDCIILRLTKCTLFYKHMLTMRNAAFREI